MSHPWYMKQLKDWNNVYYRKMSAPLVPREVIKSKLQKEKGSVTESEVNCSSKFFSQKFASSCTQETQDLLSMMYQESSLEEMLSNRIEVDLVPLYDG